MRISRRHQRWSVASALALLLVAGGSSSTGRQDLGALFAARTVPDAHLQPLLLGGPLRTLKAAVFAWPSPPGTALAAAPVTDVNRAAKADRLPAPLPPLPLDPEATSPGPAMTAAATGPAGQGTDPADEDTESYAEPGAGDPTGDPAELEAALTALSSAGDTSPDGAEDGDVVIAVPTDAPDDPPDDIADAAVRPIYQEAAFIFAADPRTLPPLGFQHLRPGSASVAAAPAQTPERAAPSPAERLGLDGKRRVRAEKCLAEAVYFESRGEPERGQIGVAQVVVNRVFSGYYPADVCRAVYQNANRRLACQFTFACDDIRDVVTEPVLWRQAQRIAADMLDGKLWDAKVGRATHYHARSVRPNWIGEMRKLDRIGEHTFYRPRRWEG